MKTTSLFDKTQHLIRPHPGQPHNKTVQSWRTSQPAGGRMSFLRKGRASVSGVKDDWQRCRDWLNNEKVTPMSAKVPDLSEIQTEFELHNYLKDGTEVCKVIGMFTIGTVPAGIT